MNIRAGYCICFRMNRPSKTATIMKASQNQSRFGGKLLRLFSEASDKNSASQAQKNSSFETKPSNSDLSKVQEPNGALKQQKIRTMMRQTRPSNSLYLRPLEQFDKNLEDRLKPSTHGLPEVTVGQAELLLNVTSKNTLQEIRSAYENQSKNII